MTLNNIGKDFQPNYGSNNNGGPEIIDSNRVLLNKDRQTLQARATNASATNIDGDTLDISASPKEGKSSEGGFFQRIYQPFQLGLNQVTNLIRGTDGMTPYQPETGWSAYPERTAPQGDENKLWTHGYNADLSANEADAPYSRTSQDGGISQQEANLASTQLAYDASLSQVEGKVTPQTARDGQTLLQSVFQNGELALEFDSNNNGRFDEQDARTLAALDEDSTTLSHNDLDIASNRFVLDDQPLSVEAPQQAQGTTPDMSVYDRDFALPDVINYFNYAANTPGNNVADMQVHNLTLEEAQQANERLQGLSTLRTSNEEAFNTALNDTSYLTAENFDNVRTLSQQMIANEGLLFKSLTHQNNADGLGENNMSLADISIAVYEDDDKNALNRGEILNTIQSFGRFNN